MLHSLQNLNERSVLYLLIAIALSSLALSAFSHYLNGEIAWWGWADGAFQNFSTEMMGAILTFFLFELVVGTRKELSRLIVDLRSSNPATVQNALAQIRAGGNLRDGSLNSINLKNAHLDGLVFDNAVLEGTDFENASLKQTSLKKTQLEEANFKGADLSEADFSSANLRLANLEGAILDDAIFDEQTILPDTQNWSEGYDTGTFTNPAHLAFWQGYRLLKRKNEDRDFEEANLNHVVIVDSDLSRCNFRDADLRRAKFSRVRLRGCNFELANLTESKLQGCNLEGANLHNAILYYSDLSLCKFNEQTILPDGSSWIYGSDLVRFTNPDHPDFWQPDRDGA